MSKALTTDVPPAAHAKAMRALDEFDSLVSQYEKLLDTQQVLVRTSNFAALFEMASRGDRLARDAALCGKRFTPLVDAVASGQFTGPRAAEIRRRSFAARSNAETLSGATSSPSYGDTAHCDARCSHTCAPSDCWGVGLPDGHYSPCLIMNRTGPRPGLARSSFVHPDDGLRAALEGAAHWWAAAPGCRPTAASRCARAG